MPVLVSANVGCLIFILKTIGAVCIRSFVIICPAFFGFGIAAARPAFGAAPQQYYPSSAAASRHFIFNKLLSMR